MTVMLEPDLEKELRRKAAEQGQGTDEYVKNLVAATLRPSLPLPLPPSQLSPEEFVKEWLKWAASHGSILSSIPDEALRRESMYDEF